MWKTLFQITYQMISKNKFRVSRDTFSKILGYLSSSPEITVRQPSSGRPQVTLEKALLMILWYFGNQDTARNIADRFGVQESTFFKYQVKIMDYFCNSLCTRFIVWPKEDEKQMILLNFPEKKGFPGVLGAVDGTHISVTPPKDREGDYINRKGFHSVVQQAVCRDDKRFTNVYC
ncbi:uncharacterized protein LOC123535934 [Mercenaria mercenaria]|uniref:uncharacterized protein LOC123535934 n=1 Tax=Mercenaria mercenaria TaxID=6596 RepID=UPI00234EECD3|nr:uncharacterized protein LOC123535934 [Mercenaria mercenaria]